MHKRENQTKPQISRELESFRNRTVEENCTWLSEVTYEQHKSGYYEAFWNQLTDQERNEIEIEREKRHHQTNRNDKRLMRDAIELQSMTVSQ